MFQELARQDNAVRSSCRSIWPFIRRSFGGVVQSLVNAASRLLLILTAFDNFYLKFQLGVSLISGVLLVPALDQFAVRGYLVRAVYLVCVGRVWTYGFVLLKRIECSRVKDSCSGETRPESLVWEKCAVERYSKNAPKYRRVIWIWHCGARKKWCGIKSCLVSYGLGGKA